jgi:demethylmenaquinone methyltransferase / 2-methoxy-6-polyprenyl-1,4-benzoquinol methylase
VVVIASERTRHARRLFEGIAPEYERMGALLGLGQDARWRRAMIERVRPVPGAWVLDVASGTGLVARDLAARRNVRVASLDPSEPMLRAGLAPTRAAGLEDRIAPVLGRAEELPFPDGTFDAVTFTYLLRYVDDPEATVRALARVIRPGGTMACVEFHLPTDGWARAGWWAYTRGVLPLVGATASPAWRRTGRFLGPSISTFWRRYPLAEQVRWWQSAGMTAVRTRVMSSGAGIVIAARRRGPLDA